MIICRVMGSRRYSEDLKIFTTKFLNFRGFYFRVSVVGRENRENLDLVKISHYTVIHVDHLISVRDIPRLESIKVHH